MGKSLEPLNVVSKERENALNPVKIEKDNKAPREDDEKPIKPVSFFAIFRFADKWDTLLLLAGCLGAAGNGASLPVFSIIFGDLMNSFGENLTDPSELQNEVNKNVLVFVYIGAGACVAAYLQMACLTASASRQVNRIRHKYLGSVLKQDIGYFDTQATSGRLLQGLNEDCITVQQGIGDKMGMTIFNLTTAVVGIIVAFTRGWDMTLVMLAVTPFLAVMGFLISIALTRFTAVANRAYADANAIAQQALSNIRTVYSFNGEPRTKTAYSDSLQQPLKVGIKQGVMRGLTLGMTNAVAFFAYALAMWYGGTRIVDGAYTGGEVLNVLFAALIGGFALGQAAPNIQYFTQAKAAAARVFDLMKRQPAIDPDAPGETIPHVQGSLSFRSVTFAYPSRLDVQVFQKFNLEVAAGKTVALVGESGSGKSTAVGLVERFYDPQEGQVLLDGVDIRCLQLKFLRAQIGLVSQEPTLFATTIKANIAYGKPGATMEDIIEAAKSANAHNFIIKLPQGYNTHVGEKGVQMSGGQKQRIAIARAILKNPKVLLLDEATSALDAESERIVQDALDRLMVNRTTVVVAHRLSTIIHADIIAVVKKGHIVEMGNHQSLMEANGTYATLVSLQQAEGSAGDEDFDQHRMEVSKDNLLSISEQHGSFDGHDASEGVLDHVVDLTVALDGAITHSVPKGGLGSNQYQRTVSGWRRFASFQRKPSKVRDVPISAPEVKKTKKVVKKVPFSRMAALNKPEMPALVGGLIGSVGLGLMMPAFSIAFSSLINVFYLQDMDELKSGIQKWSLVFVGIGVGGFLFSLFQSYFFNYMGQKLAFRVRLMMIAALMRQEVGWYDEEKNSSGVLTSKLSSDAMAVKGQFGDTMGMLTQNCVTLVAGLTIAFVKGWKMTLVVLGVVPLIGIATSIQTKYMMTAASKEDETYAQANQTAAEALSNIRTIAAFGMENEVFELYGEKLKKPTQEAQIRANTSGLGFGFSQLAIFGTYALAFWFAGVLVKRGEQTFEESLTVFFAIFLAAMGAAQSQAFFPDVAKGKAAAQHVFSIIDRKPAIDASSPDGDTPKECTGSIQLVDITFAYPVRPEAQVFKKFCLEVPAGKTVALVGESGSGKSTVVGLIERFYDPLEGKVLVDGVDIRQLNLRWLRDQIALVSQEPVLFNLTVAENICYGRPDASLEQVMEAARGANAHTFIEALPEGYDTRVGENGIQLSGGQKQRVAIARAIIKNPKILLLDEATSALDAESEHVVQEALDRLMVGRTTVMVAHRLSTVRDADIIAVVSRGTIVEQGSHEVLMAKPHGNYARLVRHQTTRSKATVKLAQDMGVKKL